MFLLLHLKFFSIMYFLCHDGEGENSAHRLSLATRSHCSLANTERQQQVCFEGELSLPSLFLLMFLLHLIFILVKYSLLCHGKGENSYSASRICVMTSAWYHVRGGASLVPLYSEVLEVSAQVSLVSMFLPLWCKASVLCRWYSEIQIVLDG
jgi:hypothetical protein